VGARRWRAAGGGERRRRAAGDGENPDLHIRKVAQEHKPSQYAVLCVQKMDG